MKVKFSKWLEGENIRVEVYKHNKEKTEPLRDVSKKTVNSLMVAGKTDIVLYDKQGNFISGDATSKSAFVAVLNDKGKEKSKWDFLKSSGSFITQEELLDRSTWVLGEAGSGSDRLTYRKYAHSIENAVKLGIHGTGSPSSTFEGMRKILMQDAGWLVNDEGSLVDKNGNYAKNYKDLIPVDKNNKIVDIKKQAKSVRISMAQYSMRSFDTRATLFQKVCKFKTELFYI